MIQMEYIQGQDRQLIAYRGTIRFADFAGDSQQIVEDAYIRVPGGWTPEADKQCMLTVVNKLLKKAKKQMVQRLMTRTRFRLTGSFDTTGTTRREPESVNRRVATEMERAYRHGISPYPLRQTGGNPEINYRAAMAMLRQVSDVAGIAFPDAFILHPRKLRNTPERRAMALLYRKIGRIRVRYMKKFGYFEEQGQHGLYRFHRDKQGGVTFIQEIEVGGLKKRPVQWDLCVQSQAPDLPPGDVILSRWLAWKADEDQFLATANFRSISTVDEATAGRREVTVNINGMDWERFVPETLLPLLQRYGE